MRTYKSYSFALIGKVCSGKSSIFTSLTQQVPKTTYTSTSFNTYDVVRFEDDEDIVNIEVLDTPGISLSEALTTIFNSTVSCLLYIVDLTKKEVYEEIEIVLKELNRLSANKSTSSCGSTGSSLSVRFGLPFVFVATRKDLVKPQVANAFIERVREKGFDAFVCDANDIEAVNTLFDDLVYEPYVSPQFSQKVEKVFKVDKKKGKKKCALPCVFF
ncbi:hypothetical protein EIN_176870 [Entamoeba invadens IP1]|uniref:hypothetical protein n=1 Tax=Entamoeba invadens IP1 TaxID=370355 RepID=UPI0002C3D4BE|nr:hypothetical protein EIN_176870 [Entamoeba invadens IP1]ELP93860.1 hypothetical protein EIN_176870 [Entamoeba invadens IP1]|eukprot:XP_004260631.1 hypothetical protein EIN_176870 [Entamoeba invadens IP1]